MDHDKDVMVDIETMSSWPTAAVIQIGACTFDESSLFLVSVVSTFYDNVPLERYHIDPKTVKWWSEQSEEAKASLNMNLVDTPHEALSLFDEWLRSVGFTATREGRPGIWANPPNFDLTILRNAYRVENRRTPWHYRQERCCRTLWREFGDLVPVDPSDDDLIKHRADHDAVRQARSANKILGYIDAATRGKVGD